MSSTLRAARTALIVAGLSSLGLVKHADAQRREPRAGVAVEQPPQRRGGAPYSPYPGSSVTIDPRDAGDRETARHHAGHGMGRVVYVPADYGYGYGYGLREGAYYPSGSYGGVTDVNGRPLSAGFDQGPASYAAPSYTPDLSGSPYVVIEGGAMLVDLPTGERRSVPSCAAQKAARDPDGRPRTVFYQPADYGVLLRQGQRGRVQGTPPAGAVTCYGIDSLGRIALLY